MEGHVPSVWEECNLSRTYRGGLQRFDGINGAMVQW
jgi:hypothetical protein